MRYIYIISISIISSEILTACLGLNKQEGHRPSLVFAVWVFGRLSVSASLLCAFLLFCLGGLSLPVGTVSGFP